MKIIIRILFITILLFSHLLIINNIYSIEKKIKADTIFKRAISYFYQKKFEMAEILFQEELKKNPDNGLAHSYLGDIFIKKKRYDGALQLYKKSLNINPGNAKDYFRIGQIYYYKKRGDLAIENFEKSFELDPSLKFAHYHIGLSYLILLRDKENTIRSWETFINIAPEDPQYSKIRRAIELLRDPSFIIPSLGSDISIEEALHLGGKALQDTKHKALEKKAGHEKKKTKHKLEEIYMDDGL